MLEWLRAALLLSETMHAEKNIIFAIPVSSAILP